MKLQSFASYSLCKKLDLLNFPYQDKKFFYVKTIHGRVFFTSRERWKNPYSIIVANAYHLGHFFSFLKKDHYYATVQKMGSNVECILYRNRDEVDRQIEKTQANALALLIINLLEKTKDP